MRRLSFFKVTWERGRLKRTCVDAMEDPVQMHQENGQQRLIPILLVLPF
jgi:hypothetical protein